MNVTFRQLKVFLKLFELRSFTATAQALNMTQSAVSKLCRELEDEVGFPLFQRSTRKVEPMDGASDFYAFATELLGTLDAASRSLADLRSVRKGTVSIAAAPLIFYGLLCEVVAEFHRLHPAVRIDGFEISTDLAIEHVINGKVDIGIVAMDGAHPKLLVEPVYTDRIYLACAEGHRFASKSKVSWKDLYSEDIIMLRADHNIGRIMRAALSRHNIVAAPTIEVGAMSSVLGLVRAGAGVAFSSGYTADFCRSEGIRLVPFSSPEQRSRTLSLIRRENARLSMAASHFVSLLKSRLAEIQTSPARHARTARVS